MDNKQMTNTSCSHRETWASGVVSDNLMNLSPVLSLCRSAENCEKNTWVFSLFSFTNSLICFSSVYAGQVATVA